MCNCTWQKPYWQPEHGLLWYSLKHGNLVARAKPCTWPNVFPSKIFDNLTLYASFPHPWACQFQHDGSLDASTLLNAGLIWNFSCRTDIWNIILLFEFWWFQGSVLKIESSEHLYILKHPRLHVLLSTQFKLSKMPQTKACWYLSLDIGWGN